MERMTELYSKNNCGLVPKTPGSSVTFGLRETSCKHNIGEEAKVLPL